MSGRSSVFQDAPGSRSALIAIAISQVLALSLWFSASAVAPQLEIAWGLDAGQVSSLTTMVQIGFVVGALAIAVLNLADAIPSRTLFVISALVGAVVNLALVTVTEESYGIAVGARFITGVALAGVYPSGLKAMAGWFERGRGMAVGVLVGALTLGSASPHLVSGLGLEWRQVIGAATLAAIGGAAVMGFAVKDGPFETAAHPFDLSLVGAVVRNREFRLATVGYLGHMWELYAFWTWTAAFLAASAAMSPSLGYGDVSTLTFAVIAIGAVGSWLAGVVSDRFGRRVAAGGAMVVSGGMALSSPLLFGRSAWLVVPVFLLWGLTVVADSAQFSVMVTEVTRPSVRGTALTLQTALGFLLTLGSIRLVPVIAEAAGWRWSFWILAIGPMVGVWAMYRARPVDQASPPAARGSTATA